MPSIWDQVTSLLGLNPNLSYKKYSDTMSLVTAAQNPETGQVLIGIGPTDYPNEFTTPIDVTHGFQAMSVNLGQPAAWPYWDAGVPPAPDSDYNWYTPFLKGEALVVGSLILGPTLIDIVAAFIGAGKKSKKGLDPQRLGDGLHRASQTLRDTTERAMPTIMAGVTNPAFAIPLIYLNLEALHNQRLIDSSIAHTLEPLMIGTEFMKALGQSGIVGQALGAFLKV